VAQTTTLLQPDQAQLTNDLLSSVVALLNATNAESVSTKRADIKPTPTIAILINAFLFFSLVLSLIAALMAMLVKQWARQYELGLGDHRRLHWQKARRRAKRHHKLNKYNFSGIILWIPMFLHVALLLFLVGIILWLYTLHIGLLIVIATLVTVGFLVYLGLAAVPTFDSHAPFVWPMSSIMAIVLRPLIKIGNAYSQVFVSNSTQLVSAAAQPPRYLLSPSLTVDKQEDQTQPEKRDKIDAYLLIELLEHTDLHEDADAALEELRLINLGTLSDQLLLFKHGALILQHCRELAETCWERGRFSPEIRDGYWARARRLCQFIEWFYYQLSVKERRAIGEWPDSTFVNAFYKANMQLATSKPLDDSMYEDVLLASSVISKLHHVQLKEGERCNICWVKKSRTQRDRVTNLLRTRDPAPEDIGRMKEMVASAFASNAECLVYHFPLSTNDEYKELVNEVAVEHIHMMLSHIDPYISNYQSLRLYLANLRARLSLDDPRLQYFNKLEHLCKTSGRNPDDFSKLLLDVETSARQRELTDMPSEVITK
jgi:hypothetical protein